MKWCAACTSINRAGAERLLFEKALDRYLAEVSASKRPSTAYGESRKAKALKKKFDAYSLAAITPDLVAEYRDERLAELHAGIASSSSTMRRWKTRVCPGRRAVCSPTCSRGPTTGRCW
jgi:hypothetical protein